MKITDQQMKELVKFARKPLENIQGYIASHNQDIRMRICYNLNKDLDNSYDTDEYQKIYHTRQIVLELASKWINGDQKVRNYLMHPLFESALYVRRSMDATQDCNAHNAKMAAYYLGYPTGGFGGIACDYNTATVVKCHQAISAYSAYSAYTGSNDTKQIIIKTILDYYGEDFETFEALYL